MITQPQWVKQTIKTRQNRQNTAPLRWSHNYAHSPTIMENNSDTWSNLADFFRTISITNVTWPVI